MKRLIVVLGGLLALPAFAEVSPFLYGDAYEYSDMEYLDDADEYADEVVAEEEEVVAKKPVASTKVSPRSTATRTGSRAVANTANVNTRRSNGASSRVVAARTTTSRTTAATPVRTTVSRGTVSRAAATSASNSSNRSVSTRRATSSNPASVARATTGTVTVQTASGKTEAVFEDNNLYDGRVGIRSSANSRVPTIRVASATMKVNQSSVSNASVAETTNELDNLAELTDYCKAQYTACMDNFCNILDDNQGRCSCSKNIKNYEKIEQALKAATEELQDVAQKIQYIGLTGDEITTLFSETEAEETMRTKTDTSQLKANLDKIKDMIIEVRTGNTSGVSDSSMSFDLSNLLDFTISSTGFDLSALFGTSTSTSSINNQRGETLYKTATSRCKASVLNSCVAQGVDASVITNSYDLEIDKQCIAYERSLSDSNDQMTATVRNAKTVLQKARLMVAQQKNQYDLRGCVSALDACMQDDYVCGPDYESCLDPTGKYIVNGQIVVGSLPGRPLNYAVNNPGMFKTSLYETWCTDSSCSKFAWDYDGQTTGNLADYINDTLYSGTTYPKQTSTNMSQFLQYKIGYNDTNKGSKDVGKNFGMCMSVLNKCQNYTYDKDRKYKPDNNVISEYLYRAMIQIKAAQDAILSEYAETCIQDVSSCLSSNGYESATNKNIPVNACKAIIATCMSVNGDVRVEPTPRQMLDWARDVYDGLIGASSDANTASSNSGSSSSSGSGTTITYAITYNCNGGSGSIGTQTCTQGTPVSLASVYGCGTKSGVSPSGWNNNATTYYCSSNTTFTAQWPQQGAFQYSITYNCNGGSGSVATQTCNSGTTAPLANASGCGTKSGYTLSGWNGGATTYACNSDTTFTAQWTQATTTYTVTFDCGEGTGNPDPATVEAGDTFGFSSRTNQCTPPSNKTFAGWKCGNQSLEPDVPTFVPNSDMTCTAQWTQQSTPPAPTTYTITYNCDGGNGPADGKTQTCTAGETVTLTYRPADHCGTKSGTSGGVSFTYGISSNWKRADNPNSQVGPTYYCGSDVTLRASWSAPAINGAGLDATCTEVDDNYTYNGCVAKNFRCRPTNFVLDGECKGPCYGILQSDPNDDFTKVYPTDSCPDGRSPDGTPGGCVAKYCKCGAYSYNTVDDNGEPICKKITTFTLAYGCGTGATGTPPSSQTYEEGELVELATDAPGCSFTGEEFNGWDCGGDNPIVNNTITMPNHNETCYAKWKPKESGEDIPADEGDPEVDDGGAQDGGAAEDTSGDEGGNTDNNGGAEPEELYEEEYDGGSEIDDGGNQNAEEEYYGGEEEIDDGGNQNAEEEYYGGEEEIEP
ncbi:MAG: InlB B-repeat-containing protein [Alphaproteobacteria bacterium]|nr:InlB B-repeat-containing protein [Alphaproteobacteria bacterium]